MVKFERADADLSYFAHGDKYLICYPLSYCEHYQSITTASLLSAFSPFCAHPSLQITDRVYFYVNTDLQAQALMLLSIVYN